MHRVCVSLSLCLSLSLSLSLALCLCLAISLCVCRLISCLIICILCDMGAQLKWQAQYNLVAHLISIDRSIGSSCVASGMWRVACGVSRGRRRKQCQSSWPMHHVNFHMEYKCRTSWNLPASLVTPHALTQRWQPSQLYYTYAAYAVGCRWLHWQKKL